MEQVWGPAPAGELCVDDVVRIDGSVLRVTRVASYGALMTLGTRSEDGLRREVAWPKRSLVPRLRRTISLGLDVIELRSPGESDERSHCGACDRLADVGDASLVLECRDGHARSRRLHLECAMRRTNAWRLNPLWIGATDPVG